ncbi:hypothetical protein LJC15_00500 [Desulfovibrio sp. OttesenSCG-928-G11]|nr:hypothetical protein [Desulfovibrio sp. OttesenSCG-928-G11]
MSSKLSPLLTQFRDATKTFSSVTINNDGPNAAPVRAGLRVWLKSFFNIGDARQQNERTIEAFRQAILTSSRYRPLKNMLGPLFKNLSNSRPLSSRSILQTLAAVKHMLKIEKRKFTTNAHITSMCGFGDKARCKQITASIMAHHGKGDPEPAELRRAIVKSFRLAPEIQKYDYKQGSIPEKKVQALVDGRLTVITACLAMLNKNNVSPELRKHLWKDALQTDIDKNTLSDMERMLKQMKTDSGTSGLLNCLYEKIMPGHISMALSSRTAAVYKQSTGKDIPEIHIHSPFMFSCKGSCINLIFRTASREITAGKIVSERDLNLRYPLFDDAIQRTAKELVKEFIKLDNKAKKQ